MKEKGSQQSPVWVQTSLEYYTAWCGGSRNWIDATKEQLAKVLITPHELIILDLDTAEGLHLSLLRP